MSKTAWSEFQRIRDSYIGGYGRSRLDEILFGWFCEECYTTSYGGAGVLHLLRAPEELALIILAEAERQLEAGKDKYHGAGQGQWKEFVQTVGRSPNGVELATDSVKNWSEETQKEFAVSKQWKPKENNYE
jgi:hypothetical protein